jgi:hypothetical protein
VDDREQLKAFASQLGRDVTDEELDGFLAGDGEDDAEVLVDPYPDEEPAAAEAGEAEPADAEAAADPGEREVPAAGHGGGDEGEPGARHDGR